jgi:carboxyl-terminal processing protease
VFNLINSNAKWLAEKREKKIFPLDYKSYKSDQVENKKELEKFSQILDYKNNLNFQLLSNQSKKIIDSKEYEEKTNRWENMLKSDIYINESVNVLSNLKTKKIQQNNILAKAG